MAKIIEFYVPRSFRKKATKWIAPKQHAKVIPFDYDKANRPDENRCAFVYRGLSEPCATRGSRGRHK